MTSQFLTAKELQFKTLAISYFTHYYDSAHHEPLTYLKRSLLLQCIKISVFHWLFYGMVIGRDVKKTLF